MELPDWDTGTRWGMSLNDLDPSNIDIVNLQKQDPKLATIASEVICVFEGCTLVTLHFDQANVNNLHQSNIYSPQERTIMFLDSFSSYQPIS